MQFRPAPLSSPLGTTKLPAMPSDVGQSDLGSRTYSCINDALDLAQMQCVSTDMKIDARPCNDGDGDIDDLVPAMLAKRRGHGYIQTALGRKGQPGDRWIPPTAGYGNHLPPTVVRC